MRLVATCHRGLETVLAGELAGLGAVDVTPRRGAVTWRGSLATLYDALIRSRSAIRILVPLVSAPTRSREELYRLASRPRWEEHIAPGQTIAVQAAGRTAGLDNTAFAAQVVKDAVVDRIRRISGGRRPSVERTNPDVSIHLHLSDERSSLALDATGEPLSHRGYRPRGGPAPLAENLAAGILLLAGYDGSQPLVDPMCGTGTIAVEAALIATRTAPGLRRGFACERWAEHDADLLRRQRERASSEVTSPPATIVARDSDPRAVKAAARNARAAGMSRAVAVEAGDLESLPTLPPGSVVVSNPPWGRRLRGGGELSELYRTIGDTLKRAAAGSSAWILIGDLQLAKSIGLRTSQRLTLFNGPVECRLLRFDLYRGSRKPSSGDRGEAEPR